MPQERSQYTSLQTLKQNEQQRSQEHIETVVFVSLSVIVLIMLLISLQKHEQEEVCGDAWHETEGRLVRQYQEHKEHW